MRESCKSAGAVVVFLRLEVFDDIQAFDWQQEGIHGAEDAYTLIRVHVLIDPEEPGDIGSSCVF